MNLSVFAFGEFILIILVPAIVFLWPITRICARAGFSPWLGVLALVPILNLVLLWYLALARWPSQDRRSA